MKKALICCAGLAVCAVCLFGFGALAVAASKNDVSVVETVLAGDPSAAEGLRVTTAMQFNEALYWDIAHESGGGSETEFSFHAAGRRSDPDIGLTMSTLGYNSRTRQELIDRAYADDPNHERNSLYAKVSDYYDFYPIEFTLNIPGCETDEHFEENLSNALRIPVDPTLQYHFTKGGTSLTGQFKESYEHPTPAGVILDCSSAVVEDGCYFVLSTHPESELEKSLPLDMNRLPMGYGVYFLPIANGRAASSSLEMVYPLDPAQADVARVCTVSGGEKLLVFTGVGNEYTCTVLDRVTHEAEDSFFVCKAAEDAFLQHFEHDDSFAALAFSDSTVAVVAEESGGGYALQFTVTDLSDVRLYSPVSVSSNSAMAWRGGRLAIVSPARDSCDYHVRIYDRTGQIFWGGYTASLTGEGMYRDSNFRLRADWD